MPGKSGWHLLGTFDVPNPVGPLAPTDGTPVPGDKMFVQDMFPYPSGEGLHVGHPLGYIATDVYARYYRMTGRNVLHALGFDSFGLPAEQYAMQTGTHPRTRTEANIVNFRRQLGRLGSGPRCAAKLLHHRRRVLQVDAVDLPADLQRLVRHRRSIRARRIDELIGEFESGQRSLDDGRQWAALAADDAPT